MPGPFQRDLENESAELLRQNGALESREIDRPDEALNGPNARAAVRALAEKALRVCAAEAKEASAQLCAAYEDTKLHTVSRQAGATLAHAHAQVYHRQPVPS